MTLFAVVYTWVVSQSLAANVQRPNHRPLDFVLRQIPAELRSR